MKREEETNARWWTFGHTAPWIAVLQVIAALAQARFDISKVFLIQKLIQHTTKNVK